MPSMRCKKLDKTKLRKDSDASYRKVRQLSIPPFLLTLRALSANLLRTGAPIGAPPSRKEHR